MESLYFLIPLFLIVFITFPISLNIRASFNLKNKKGIVSLYVFNIRLTVIEFRLQDNNIFIKKNKKEEIVEFELSEKQKRFAKQFSVQIQNKVNVKNLVSFTRIGTKDALETSMYNGIINSVFACVFGYIKNLKPYAKIDVLSYPAFNKNLFIITLYGKISISFFDFIYSLLMSFIIIKRSEKYEGNK